MAEEVPPQELTDEIHARNTEEMSVAEQNPPGELSLEEIRVRQNTERRVPEEETPRELILQVIPARNFAEMSVESLELFGIQMPEGGHCHVRKEPEHKPRKSRQKRHLKVKRTRRSVRAKGRASRSNVGSGDLEEEHNTALEKFRAKYPCIRHPELLFNEPYVDLNQPEEDEDFRGFPEGSFPKIAAGGVLYKFQKSAPVPSLDPADVTEEMLANISSTHNKVYDSIKGTTCHQCRQKTKDTKTVCRSGECRGKRGMFCGPCLRNRYGEKVQDALKDKDWKCPPCQGLCNCSVCRIKQGYNPTGILAPYVKNKGYKSVMDYLIDVDDDSDD